MGYSYLTEAFKKLNLLEDDFSFSGDIHKVADDLQSFVADDIEAPEEEVIIDTEADTADDLQDTYVGKVILECACCHSRIYKDQADVIISEEGDLANIDEKCPVCNTTSGFKIIGKIEEFDNDSEPKEDVVEEPAEEPVENEDDLTDDEIEEALKEALGKKVEEGLVDKGEDELELAMEDPGEAPDAEVSDEEDVKEDCNESKCEGDDCKEEKDDELTEGVHIDMNNKEVDTDSDNVKVDVNAGTVEVGDAADEAPLAGEGEMIAPLNDEEKAEIEGNDIEDLPLDDLGGEVDVDTVDEPVDDLGAEADANVEDDLGLEGEPEEKPEEEPLEGEEETEEDEEELPNESLKTSKVASDDSKKLDEEKDPENELEKEHKDAIKEIEKNTKEAVKTISEEKEDVCPKCGKNPCECKDEDCKEESLEKSKVASDDSKKLDEEDCEDKEFDCEEFDEESFDDLCESYLKRVYENVASFKTTSCELEEGVLNVTGDITFNDNKVKSTTFLFSNPRETKRGAIVYEGMNKTFSNALKPFSLRGNIINNKYVAESMIYTYSTKTLNESNESEVTKIYGRVAIKK